MKMSILEQVLTFAEAAEVLGKSSQYMNDLVKYNKIVEGLHFRSAGRVKLVKLEVVEQIKRGEFEVCGLVGAKWGELTVDKQNELLSNACCVDGATGNTCYEGECIVDLNETLSISGSFVDGEIIIDDNAEIYSPIA